MQLSNKKIAAFSIILLVGCFSVFFACGETGNNSKNKPFDAEKLYPESFTFFDLGSNTKISDDLQKNLSGQLGSYSIEKMTILDLVIHNKAIFGKHFPNLFELHSKLNDEKGARIEHNITNLTFRYLQNENTPFESVKLTFSNYSNKPLLFSITSKKKESYIVDTLKEKYGEPAVINWEDGKSLSLLWEKNRDFLIFSKISERGSFKYSIMIYFVNNIENLLQIEQDEIKKREEERKKAGKTAF
ncbi:MAG: hypothetical protein KKD47_01045 [Proteobacteria bacterium]|nr:hypothetical protein [Pseudomonadota bacterium]